MARKSIIPHTISCPHCGHRTLPENLAQHIRVQHPTEHEDNIRSTEMDTPEPNLCPYCNQKLPIKKLENHILRAHPLQKKIAEQRVTSKELEAQREKRLRRQDLNEVVRAKSKATWTVKQKAEKTQQKVLRDLETIFCQYCYQPILRGDLEKHLELKHPDKK